MTCYWCDEQVTSAGLCTGEHAAVKQQLQYGGISTVAAAHLLLRPIQIWSSRTITIVYNYYVTLWVKKMWTKFQATVDLY